MTPLTPTDYAALEKSYLTREIVDAAKIQRVDTIEGAEIVGRPPTAAKDYAGQVFPYFWPGDQHPREYRLRRDNPDLEQRPDGSIKEKEKYLGPRKSVNRLYIPPSTPVEWLTDPSIPVIITEGEKKALALYRYYQERGEKRLVIGLSGAWNFRGVVGKATNSNGKSQDVSGIIFDFDRINWRGREVLIVFDVNVLTDEGVAAARRELTREIQRRGANPSWVNLPTGIAGVNGVDDLLAIKGTDFFAGLIASAESAEGFWETISEFDSYSLPEFPLKALPPWLRSFVEGLARQTQTPIDLVAMLALSALAGALCGKVEVTARKGWAEPINLYIAIALPPGNRKSAVFSPIVKPIEMAEADLVANQRGSVAKKESEIRTLSLRLEHLEKAAAKIDDETERKNKREEAEKVAEELAAQRVPILPRLLADDATPETLATLLYQQHGRIALFSPEGDLFDIMAGRYSNGAPNLGIFLKGHAGDDHRVDRRGRAEYINRPALTIGLAVQPGVLRGLVGKPGFKDRGLLGRFLYSIPDSLLGSRLARPSALEGEANTEYRRRVKGLALEEVEIDEETGIRDPVEFKLSAEADDYLAGFQDEIEPLLAEGGDLSALSDWAGKLCGAVVRIAGILHAAEISDTFSLSVIGITPISAATFKKALSIGRYLIPHAKAAFAEMGADPEIEAARALLRWIESAKSTADSKFSRREAQTANPTKFPKVTDLDPALKLLEAHGYIRAVESRRRDSHKFEINPSLWDSEKRKIKRPKTFSTFSSSQGISETLLTNETSTAETAEGFRDSDFEYGRGVNGHHLVEPEAIAPKASRKRVSL